jgi:hypothetical protein
MGLIRLNLCQTTALTVLLILQTGTREKIICCLKVYKDHGFHGQKYGKLLGDTRKKAKMSYIVSGKCQVTPSRIICRKIRTAVENAFKICRHIFGIRL